MNQEHTPGVRAFSHAQNLEIETITNTALTEVETKYGSGFPTYTGGEQDGLSYHNRYHTESVYTGAVLMSQALGLSPADQALAGAAAAAHDIVQGKPRGVMEQESAEWLTVRLEARGLYGAADIEAARLAILATEPDFANGTAISRANELVYPSRTAEGIAFSVASADFSKLLTPIGVRLAHDVYKEIKGVSQNETPDFVDVLEYQRKQVIFVENFRFPHPLAEQLFGGLRSEVTDFTVDLVGRLESGEIENWRQLMAADDAFIRQHTS